MASVKILAALLVAICSLSLSNAKIYDRCDFYKELRDRRMFPADQIATWVCIAYSVSGLNTEYTSPKGADGSQDHGIFQVNDRYWCSPPGPVCGVTCDELKSDDITKAVECARMVYDEWERIRSNGFSAWTSYQFCNTPEKVYPYVAGC